MADAPADAATSPIVGVRLTKAGPVHFFTTTETELAPGDRVIVPTPAGPTVGQVAIAPHQLRAFLPPRPETALWGRAPAEEPTGCSAGK